MQKFRYEFKYQEIQQNDEMTETDEGKIVLKTYFDAKLLVKNKALHDRNYELFEKCHSMTDEEAMKALMVLFKNDEQFRMELKQDFDKEHLSTSSQNADRPARYDLFKKDEDEEHLDYWNGTQNKSKERAAT